jgi:hypothetical protein
MALACSEPHLMTMYELLCNPHFIDYLQGGPSSHGPNKNELLLRRAQVSNELI